jgi:hypothetical protein
LKPASSWSRLPSYDDTLLVELEAAGEQRERRERARGEPPSQRDATISAPAPFEIPSTRWFFLASTPDLAKSSKAVFATWMILFFTNGRLLAP